MAHLRLVLTNDLFGSFFTEPVSWGRTAGADALVRTVDRLREGADAAAWIDCGDFSGGGPLAPATEGALGWEAAATLPFDAAIPGNHEFDYGDEVVRVRGARLAFPLIGADLVDLPGFEALAAAGQVVEHWVLSAPGGASVGVLGLTLVERRGLHVYDTLPDVDGAVTRVRHLAHELGPHVDHLVLVVHDGVDILPTDSVESSRRVGRLCEGVRGAVDAVVGGHTVNHHMETLAGVPFLQPWAFGAEVGVLDFDPSGVRLETVWVPADPLASEDGLGWSGPGGHLVRELRATVVGEVGPALTTLRSGGGTLGPAIAAGVRSLTGAEVSLVTHTDVACGQLCVDGIYNWIPSGPVTEAQTLRALPWAVGDRGDGTWRAELTSEEATAVADALTTVTGAPFVATGGTVGQVGAPGLRDEPLPAGAVVVNTNYLRAARRAVRRDVEWSRTGVGLRDGLRAALNRSLVG